MANAIVALITLAAMLVGVTFMSQEALRSVDSLSDSWKQMEVRSDDISRTGLEVIATTHDGQGITLTVRNSGHVALRDFEAWDVVVQYTRPNGVFHQEWLPYTANNPPGNNQWTVVGIYLDAAVPTSEEFQPGILDPGEEMKLKIVVSPPGDTGATHTAILGTPNGVTVSTSF